MKIICRKCDSEFKPPTHDSKGYALRFENAHVINFQYGLFKEIYSFDGILQKTILLGILKCENCAMNYCIRNNLEHENDNPKVKFIYKSNIELFLEMKVRENNG
jgi:hypothetical protein